MRLSIRLRLTLWYTALIGASLVVFSVGIVLLHERWGRAQFDSELVNLGATAARIVDEEFAESGSLQRAANETRASLNVPGRATAILDDHGTPLAAHWRGFEPRSIMSVVSDRAEPSFHTMVQQGATWRILLQPETVSAGRFTIVVAGPLDQLARQHHLLTRVLWIGGPLMMLITGVISWWVASSALQPVTTMARQAEAITVQSRDWQLDGESDDDELGQLARAFNRLLGRLASASQTQRQFMADASHELRTPVSVIQTAAEVTLDRQERDESEYREALTIIDEQSGRLGRMVEDMFLLARGDVGAQVISTEPLQLGDVVEKCVRAASVVAATRGIVLTSRIDADLAVIGNDDLLRQLVTNLLDNALQYTPTGGRVSVAVSAHGDQAAVSVSDTGPGIPPAERERIFERFVRLDPARSAASGAGLGLSIARWIADEHGGTLTVAESTGGGTVFTFRLRLAELHIDRGQPVSL